MPCPGYIPRGCKGGAHADDVTQVRNAQRELTHLEVSVGTIQVRRFIARIDGDHRAKNVDGEVRLARPHARNRPAQQVIKPLFFGNSHLSQGWDAVASYALGSKWSVA